MKYFGPSLAEAHFIFIRFTAYLPSRTGQAFTRSQPGYNLQQPLGWNAPINDNWLPVRFTSICNFDSILKILRLGYAKTRDEGIVICKCLAKIIFQY